MSKNHTASVLFELLYGTNKARIQMQNGTCARVQMRGKINSSDI